MSLNSDMEVDEQVEAESVPSGVSRRNLLIATAVALMVATAAFWSTFRSMVEQWSTNDSFSHGFLILPIALWLTWRLRQRLARTTVRPSAWGCGLVLACLFTWGLARLGGVLVLEQIAFVALVPALVLTGLGTAVTWILIFPLAFLFFMVPFGSGLVPHLVQATADAATILLNQTGVPVLKTHVYLVIPYGQFEVARACSGLNYFVTSLVLGTLYAYLYFRSWPERVLCVAVFLIFPIVVNILRVYIIVLVSYLTEFRFGPGAEHVLFGRIFFLATLALLFWAGRRWHEEAPSTTVAGGRVDVESGKGWWPLLVSVLLILATPYVVHVSMKSGREPLDASETSIVFPPANGSWEQPDDGAAQWRPHYRGAVAERQAVFRSPDGLAIDLFVAVYGLGATQGAEMITHGNVIATSEWGSVEKESKREIMLNGGQVLRIREIELPVGLFPKLVWQWYVVGDRPMANSYSVKAHETLALLTRSARSERVVAVSTRLGPDAAERLEDFVAPFGQCAARGFRPEACGE